MRLLTVLFSITLILLPTTAEAGEKILFAPTPDWVIPASLENALAKDDADQLIFLIVDSQVKLEAGVEERYTDFALHATSVDVIPVIAGLIKGVWQPEQGDFTVHRLEIFRDGKLIKPLENGLKFDILRREAALEKQQINGLLTATTEVEDIQVGDIVRFSASVTRSNPALTGRAEFSGQILEQSFVAAINQMRIIWPSKDHVSWKLSVADHPRTLTKTGKYMDLRMGFALDEKPEYPEKSPARFRLQPFVEASNFKSWEEVSAVAATLYQTKDTISADGALAAEVSKIAMQTSDPTERTALALQLVQDKVRYLYNGLGFGNYNPQSPEETWLLRYGDCKAKTLLLLSILHKLGVEAVPMLVNLNLQDGVVEHLPGFQVFNHILVRAQIDGRYLWVDGTGSGSRIEDLFDAPAHRYGLPLLAGGSGLEAIDIRPLGRPFENLDTVYDLTAGTVFPAIFDFRAVLRTSKALQLNSARQTLADEEFNEQLDEIIGDYVPGAIISQSDFTYDERRGETTVTGHGLSYFDWQTGLGKKRYVMASALADIELDVDRTKAEWKHIPALLAYPSYFKIKRTIKLPQTADAANGFSLSGKTELHDRLAGLDVHRTTAIENNQLKFEESYLTAQWEIAADQLLQAEKQLAAAKKHDAALVAPAKQTEDWQQVEMARQSGALDLLAAEFDAIIAYKPDDESSYDRRAYFHQLSGDYVRAAKDVEREIAIKPSPDAWTSHAQLIVGDDPKVAIASLQQALALGPVNFSAIQTMVNIYLDLGQAQNARKALDHARTMGFSDDLADALLTDILLFEGQAAAADDIYSRLIEDDIENISLRNERCWLRGRANIKLQEALVDCTDAVEMLSEPASPLDSRALIYYRLGQYDAAIADLNRALRISPDSSSSRYLRGLVHKAKGDPVAAENDRRAAMLIYKYVGADFKRVGLEY